VERVGNVVGVVLVVVVGEADGEQERVLRVHR